MEGILIMINFQSKVVLIIICHNMKGHHLHIEIIKTLLIQKKIKICSNKRFLMEIKIDIRVEIILINKAVQIVGI